MTLPNSANIVNIGGGEMGASTLYHLVACGQKSVLLFEPDEFFGKSATGCSAGEVRYQFSTEIDVRFTQESLPMLARFEEGRLRLVQVYNVG